MFSFTSCNITVQIDNNCMILSCEALDKKGDYCKTTINLNSCIENKDGKLRWTESPNGNFLETTKDIKFSAGIEPHLFATCQLADGRWCSTSSHMNLNERIANIDGSLVFK